MSIEDVVYFKKSPLDEADLALLEVEGPFLDFRTQRRLVERLVQEVRWYKERQEFYGSGTLLDPDDWIAEEEDEAFEYGDEDDYSDEYVDEAYDYGDYYDEGPC